MTRDETRAGDDKGSLLDLPLGTSAPPSFEKSPGQSFQDPPDPAPRGRRPFVVWALPLLFVLGLGAGYLLPRIGPPRAELSAEMLDLGEAAVDTMGEHRTVDLKSVGRRNLAVRSAELRGEAAQEYELADDGCRDRVLITGAACTVVIQFKPRASGIRPARLVFVGPEGQALAEATLLGTGLEPRLAADQSGLDFDGVPLGELSSHQAVILSNLGGADLTLGQLSTAGPEAEDFTLAQDHCSGLTLNPGNTCRVEIRFGPTRTGLRRGRLLLPSTESSDLRVSLVGRGFDAGPVARASTQEVSFGMVVSGEGPAHRTITVTSTGTSPLLVTGTVVEEKQSGVRVVGDGCTGKSLAPQDSCQLELAYEAAVPGFSRAYLEIRHDGIGSPLCIPVLASASEARISVHPPFVVFPGAALGEVASLRQIRLENHSSSALEILALRLTGAGSPAYSLQKDDCSGRSLDTGGECLLELSFRPRRRGPHEARLEIGLGGATLPHSVPLSGQGLAGHLVVDPETIEGGQVPLSQSVRKSVTLANDGAGPLTITRLEIADESSGATFRIARSDCQETGELGPGESCTLSLLLSPVALGPHRAKLRVVQGHDLGELEIPLVVEGIEAQKTRVRISPSEVSFGRIAVGRRSSIVTVSIQNQGPGLLTLGEVVLNGLHEDDFHLVSGSCDGAAFVARDGACTLGLRFSPSGPGRRQAYLTIHHNGAHESARIPLTGSGH